MNWLDIGHGPSGVAYIIKEAGLEVAPPGIETDDLHGDHDEDRAVMYKGRADDVLRIVSITEEWGGDERYALELIGMEWPGYKMIWF